MSFLLSMCIVVCFFFKQNPAYEMRISDWSSDVCSSDLTRPDRRPHSITSSKGQNPSCITGGNHRSPDPKQAPRDRILARLQDHVFGAVAVSCDDLGVGGKGR